MAPVRLTRFAQVREALETLGPSLPATAGPRLAHCAQSIECSLTGYPQPRAWLIRTFIGPRVLARFLKQGVMSHDVNAGIAGLDDPPATLTPSQGRDRLLQAMEAFERHSGPLAPHFAYGPVERGEYEAVHSMHVADHLTALVALPK